MIEKRKSSQIIKPVVQWSGIDGSRARCVALSITASGSFVAKHKLPHIKEKDLRTQDFKSEDPFFKGLLQF